MAMLAAFLAAQFALVFAGSHGSKVTLELKDNMKLPATYNQFTKSQVLPCYHCRAIISACGNETVSRETERCQAVALRECGMRKWPRLGELTYQLFGVN